MADASQETIQCLIKTFEKELSQIEISLPLILKTRTSVEEAIKKQDGRNDVLELTLTTLDTILAENEVIYDLSASLNALLKAKNDYTKRFYMQILNLCFVETCQLLVGESGDDYGLLSRLLVQTKYLNQAGCQYIIQHIVDDVQKFNTQYADKEMRNTTRHYDDPIKMYERLIGINNIDFFAKGASQLIAICMELSVVSAYLLKLFAPNMSQCQNAVLPSKCGLDLKVMFNEAIFKALKEKNLINSTQHILENAQRSLDKCYSQYRSCCKVADFIIKNGSQEPKDLVKMKDLIKLRMETLLLRYDIACAVWGYMNASLNKESSQNLRLIHITKQAALTHIYGYNEKSKRQSLWSKILKFEDASSGKLDTSKVENSLKTLTMNLTLDNESSRIFAHYRYKRNFYIPARLEAFGKMLHYQELIESHKLLNVCNELEKFMIGMMFCMNEKQKQDWEIQHDEWMGKIDDLVAKAGGNKEIADALQLMRKLIDNDQYQEMNI